MISGERKNVEDTEIINTLKSMSIKVYIVVDVEKTFFYI